MQRNHKRSSFIFYTTDWLRDHKLNSCSLQAQGAWIRLLCFMAESEIYGCLWGNDKPDDEKAIQNLLGLGTDYETFKSIWNELLDRGVVKVHPENGSFYSKKMVNDYKKMLQGILSEGPDEETLKTITNVITYLNEKSKQNFTIENKKHFNIIYEKIISGYKLKDFKLIIDNKCEEWETKFITPNSLFGDNFLRWLKDANDKKIKKDSIKTANPYKDMEK